MFYLFSLNIFLSSFLIFLIQPIFTKLILPHLGNTPLVWNCSMIFYQTILLAGYLYAYLLSHIKNSKLVISIQWAILLVSLLSIPLELKYYLQIDRFISPHLWLFSALLVSIGLVFFILSSNTPLNQDWFASTQTNQKKVYSLYSISNFGNLLALLLYPLLFEPLSLEMQQEFFSIFYLFFIISVIPCSYLVMKRTPSSKILDKDKGQKVLPSTILLWVVLSFIPSSLMIGVTSQLTENLNNTAIFWIMPLALYLLSYILAFLPKPPQLEICTKIVPFFTFATIFVALQDFNVDFVVLLLFLLSFFLVSYVLTAKLAKLTPEKSNLTLFYLIISLGSILGSIFNSLIAPVKFIFLLEYPIINLLALLVLINFKPGRLKSIRHKTLNLAIILFFSFMVFEASHIIQDTIVQERNFFGINRIVKDNHSGQPIVTVANKRLNYQYDLLPLKPLQSIIKTSSKIAQVGAINDQFCRVFKGSFDYLEPNKFIKDLLSKENIFPRDSNCNDHYSIYLGDPRIILAQSSTDHYQAIIFDLNSINGYDHMITLEAIESYKSKLAEGNSFLLFAFSNNQDQLINELSIIASNSGLKHYFIQASNHTFYFVMLSKDTFAALRESSWQVINR